MKRESRYFASTVFVGVLITVGLLGMGEGWFRTSPAIAVDEVITFEVRAGLMGRSELYAREQSRSVLLPVADSAPVLLAKSAAPVLTETLTYTTYLPMTSATALIPLVERRGLWVTRYDWTSYGQAPSSDDINTIVNNASYAGFNTLFFQIRAAGDSYYTPGLEPWAARLSTGPVSETLGVDPGWDPLAVMLQTAHAAGIEVHAYINVYTAWLPLAIEGPGQLAPPATVPPHMFDTFTYGPSYTAHPGLYALKYTWRQYSDPNTPMPLKGDHYLWASPGVDLVQDHIAAVVSDIVTRYAVDGVHLDLVRYAGPSYSYDPSSNAIAGTIRTPDRDQWQRGRISSLVARISAQAHTLRPDILVSAAVWPVYRDKWGWGTSQGYSDFFQDSKGWLQDGAVDAIAPMLYGGVAEDMSRWQILMDDFLSTPSAGQVYPGIGVYDEFGMIAERITAARDAGAPGHVIFSCGGLAQRGFWDDLRDGPYAHSAIIPNH